MAIPECSCDNSHVVFVREATTPDGRRNKYYKCLNCQRDYVVTESNAPERSQ